MVYKGADMRIRLSFSPMTSKAPVLPPLDTTLPETVAFHEKHNASLPAYVFSKDGTEGVTEVSYDQFAKASRRVPQFLGIDINPTAKPVVAIIAHTDTLLYHTILLGMMRVGAILFPISPRNTAAAVVHLLKKTSCHYVLGTRTSLRPLFESVEKDFSTNDPTFGLTIVEVPVLGQLYPELSNSPASHELVDLFPDHKPSLDDVGAYLHSSGSTGLPKAVPLTHREIMSFVRSSIVDLYQGGKQPIRTACMALPPFHGMGFVLQVHVPFFLGVPGAIFPPVMESAQAVPILPDANTLLDHTERTKATSLFTVPAFLHIWAHEKRSIEFLKTLKSVTFGGGALSPQVAQILSGRGVRLVTAYGGTEFGFGGMSSLKEGDEVDWEYMEMNPNSFPKFVPQGDGTYELQFVSPEGQPQRSATNIPGVNGYATSDIFVRHPTKDYLWKIVGRLDDVLIHSSGEKTVPQPMEAVMESSPYVQGAVMFGQARDQPGVLIEPRPEYAIDVEDASEVAAFRNLIWPVVEQANKVAPAFSKIFKEMILITSKAKPLPRTPKGTAVKKMSIRIYADEIDTIYSNVDAVLATDLSAVPKAWDIGSISLWILDQVGELCPEKTITASGNLFEQGLDSLSATILRRRIVNALSSNKTAKARTALQMITQNTIYGYPTVDSLAKFLVTALTDPESVGSSKSQVEILEEMIKKYSFDGRISQSDSKTKNDIVVLITGSTGYLGSHVLEGLLRDEKVIRIYALNRPSGDGRSSAERHLRRFRDKGLDEALLASTKLIHIASDYSQENLGVPESTYNELRDSVNVVIHVAWRLDFNLSLSSFESNVRGTRNLAALARAGPHAASTKFIFTSSVGVAQAWDQSIGPYPEEILSDAKVAVGSGYGEAKYVSERILATSGLNVTSVRIGQITGTEENGAWATTDWVPILVKSSLAMGALPNAKGDISWLSSNAVAGTILDLMTYDGRYPEAMNIVHPKCITWNSAMGYMQEALQKECNASVPLIPFKEWFAILDKHSNQSSNDEMMKIPAIKLHSFFRQLSAGDLAVSPFNSQSFSMAEFATGKMRSISKTLASLPPLTEDHPFKWIKYWKDEGLFN